MNPLGGRRVALLAIGLVGLVVVAVAALLGLRGGAAKVETPPAPRGALRVTMGETRAKLDPKAALRCFVAGRFVGETSLADCAQKNGVDPGRMDVGVDKTGQVAAAGEGQAELAPLPEARPAPPPGQTPEAAAATAPPPAPGAGACLRYAGGRWREAGVGMSLRACVRTLFEGRCVRPGEALYGRYGATSLRLVPGRVEASDNNRDFQYVVGQDAEACVLDG